ncbi:phosphoserine aminotransferase [Salpingoeca rosetta]|uniref:phosphoserine transaminase n=1 Tax=Salpingoeca rosetta (strain ATCC 50818 / BSB-021) TaxID=946362 RepID=F2U7C9_SALR5|nr:phosphoserine aminotransferase [Salpingoeca rosetta]EGD83346.1 phosphoserine aminotransferase [Salpingoeca rosetta]|eukprot:XP_004994850.1 phosphoserine aminotransferase [Salpingoeca rosetta]
MATTKRVLNFSAGPARLPLPVLERVSTELFNWHGCGMSVMEMSHRGKDFKSIIEKAEADLRKLMSIPDNYKVLFLQGGATAQFAAVPLNLTSDSSAVADYIVSGGWSAKAEKEAHKFCKTHVVNPIVDKYTDIADESTFNFSEKPAYVYYCDNETVFGVEFPHVPAVPEGVERVCDMSSNFLTRRVDVSKVNTHGCACESVGGLRASLYNATTMEETEVLAQFMRDFQAAHA